MAKPVVRSVNALSGKAHSGRFRKSPPSRHRARHYPVRARTQARRRPRYAPGYAVTVSALRVALVAVGATVLTAACAAGQNAQTAYEQPSLDGTHGRIGLIL